MNQPSRFEVKTQTGNTVITGEKEALDGLRIISSQIAMTGWDDLNMSDPTDIEYTRAKSVDIGINGKLGDHPKILRFSENTPTLWNNLESAELHSGALVRTGRPVYNASLAVSRGKIVLIANSDGVKQIEEAALRDIAKGDIAAVTSTARTLR